MIEIGLAILASYFLARTLAMEEGPGIPFGNKEERKTGVFLRIRDRIDPKQETWLGRGLNCPKCVGCYTSLGIAFLLPFTTWQGFIINWLGIAGAVVLVHLWIEK